MPLVKKLYLFILNTFLPLFLMTFFISLFVLLMQFLWKYVDELVGKGIEVGVLGELFFYAALTIVPMALPLSMLLASLMTFGNLGERLELLAIKAAGISLRQTMNPLIIAVLFIAAGAFNIKVLTGENRFIKENNLVLIIFSRFDKNRPNWIFPKVFSTTR